MTLDEYANEAWGAEGTTRKRIMFDAVTCLFSHPSPGLGPQIPSFVPVLD
jgi:hypothetical protein